jgi:uncharacterized protein YlxW (UPF0749 family)
MAILLFIFFLTVFILMLIGSRILKKLKDAKKAVEEAADLKEQRLRNETGRQRQQYSQRQQPRQTVSEQYTTAEQPTAAEEPIMQQEEARRMETATGETIIDHHHENRENKKIFDDEEGEYVEFEEA